MTRTILSWRRLCLGCAVLALTVMTTARADEDGDQGKGKKGKGKKADVIQIDLSKLPPDLAKALQKYATDSKKPDAAKKGPKAGKKSGDAPETAAGTREKTREPSGAGGLAKSPRLLQSQRAFKRRQR